MAPFIVAEIIDDLAAAADAARAGTTDQRWLTALDTGFSWLLLQDQIEFNPTYHELTVNSPSGERYIANGTCACTAFSNAKPCWHRAAARLVRRALERQEEAQLSRVEEIELAIYAVAWDEAVARKQADLERYARQWDVTAETARIAHIAAERRARIYAEADELYA